MAKLVKMPSVEELEGANTAEIIIAFSRSLGWDGQTMLDPRRGLLHPEDAKELCGKCVEVDRDGSLLYINVGPAMGDEVPKGQVLLEDGGIVAQ